MPKLIVITSGKGGVGKTTSAVNLAVAMASFGEDVTLVDANLTTPNVGLHLGAPVVPVTLNHVLSGKTELIDAVYEHSSGTKIVPSSLSVSELKRTHGKDLLKLSKDLKKISDIVIFDSAAGLGEEAISALSIADDILIITNPDMPAVTDALKTAKVAGNMKKNILGVIVSRVRGKDEMSLDSIQEMLELPILGIVPEDDCIRESLSARNAVVVTHPKSKAAQKYKEIAAKILGREVPRKKGFWARVFGR